MVSLKLLNQQTLPRFRIAGSYSRTSLEGNVSPRFVLRRNCITLRISWPGGEIGRRTGLKIPGPQRGVRVRFPSWLMNMYNIRIPAVSLRCKTHPRQGPYRREGPRGCLKLMSHQHSGTFSLSSSVCKTIAASLLTGPAGCFEVALFSPFSPKMGEKVADRPDEGDFNQFCVRKKPPHPNPLPQVICGNATWPYSVNPRKRLGGRGDSTR